MRLAILYWMALMLSMQAYAADENQPVVAFENLQESCVQVGEITFGPGGRWSSCHVTRGRWVATMDLIDVYQAQYCLSKNEQTKDEQTRVEQTCDQKALVLFGNRAYTKDAKVLLLRLDAANTQYDDPLVVISGDERVMSVPVHASADSVSTQYYLWRADRWVHMDGQAWQHDLSAKLPSGTSVRQAVWPDLETMSAHANLYLAGDADCCPTGGIANIDLDVQREQFAVKKVNIGLATQ